MTQDDDGICCQRPYPFIICNAARPDECKRQPDGFCRECYIRGFHADRPPESENDAS